MKLPPLTRSVVASPGASSVPACRDAYRRALRSSRGRLCARDADLAARAGDWGYASHLRVVWMITAA
jgi:hypothetical protein